MTINFEAEQQLQPVLLNTRVAKIPRVSRELKDLGRLLLGAECRSSQESAADWWDL